MRVHASLNLMTMMMITMITMMTMMIMMMMKTKTTTMVTVTYLQANPQCVVVFVGLHTADNVTK